MGLSRNILVQLFPECIQSQRHEIFGLVQRMAGVARVVDLEVVSEETLRSMLFQKEPITMEQKEKITHRQARIEAGERPRAKLRVIAESRAEVRKDAPTMVSKPSLKDRMRS